MDLEAVKVFTSIVVVILVWSAMYYMLKRKG